VIFFFDETIGVSEDPVLLKSLDISVDGEEYKKLFSEDLNLVKSDDYRICEIGLSVEYNKIS